MNYEFKSTESNVGKVHPNVHEQPYFPELNSDDDSDMSNEYISNKPNDPKKDINKILEYTDSSDESDDKKTYTVDDL